MTRPGRPLVSVVITVRNEAALARTAVESMLAQTVDDLEVIVVDDGSTDGTPEVLRAMRDPRIRLVAPAARLGRTRCLNQGVGLAGADVVAIMDGDDISFPDRLEHQLGALDDDPGLDLVGARILRVDPAGVVLDVGPDPARQDAFRERAWRSIPIPHPTWCGRRRWFQRHPYRTWIPCSEDQEVLYRASGESRYACLDHVLVVKRERELARSTLLRRRGWFAAGALAGDVGAGEWQRAGAFAVRTAGAAARFALAGGAYEPTWRWSPPDDGVVERYQRLRRTVVA